MATIYARIPDELKTALDDYQSQRKVKLTAAMVELMEIGLGAVTDKTTVAALTERLSAAEAAAAVAREMAVQAENARQALESRMNSQADAFAAVGGALNQTIGKCPNPNCGKPISGRDLVVSHACGTCGGSLADLLDPAQTHGSSINGTQYLLLIGALGLLVGMAVVAQSKNP